MERKENGSLKLKEFLKVFFATESFSRVAKFAKSGNRTEQFPPIFSAEEKPRRNEEIIAEFGDNFLVSQNEEKKEDEEELERTGMDIEGG